MANRKQSARTVQTYADPSSRNHCPPPVSEKKPRPSRGRRTLETRIFFLDDDGAVERIARHAYADVVTGRRAMPMRAGRRVRVADWYVERAAGRPGRVQNETYSILNFDERGRALPLPDCCWRPTAKERRAMEASLGLRSRPIKRRG